MTNNHILKASYHSTKAWLKTVSKVVFEFLQQLEKNVDDDIQIFGDHSIKIYKKNALLTYIQIEDDRLYVRGKPNGTLRIGTTDNSSAFTHYVLKTAISAGLESKKSYNHGSKWQILEIPYKSKYARRKLQLVLDSIENFQGDKHAHESPQANNNLAFVDETQELYEGSLTTIQQNKYERNLRARQICLAYWGYSCKVCQFNFEEKYGLIGKHFIHVHHIKPIATIKKTYKIDPITDLIPICPNCHSIIHRTSEVMDIETLKTIIQKNGS